MIVALQISRSLKRNLCAFAPHMHMRGIVCI